ncbi:hypothetical protein [Methylocystis sp.]|uniref:hypothetical protein n=1 Tax=Methylocystis sp. TaxID=1911079 RepID=UPI003DA4C833
MNSRLPTYKIYDASSELFSGSFSDSCFAGPNKSVNLIVENKSNKTIRNPTVAYFAYGADFWGDPINLARSVTPGKRIEKSIGDLDVRLKHVKFKFQSEEKTFLAEENANFPWFIKCAVLTVNKDGSYSLGLVWGFIG